MSKTKIFTHQSEGWKWNWVTHISSTRKEMLKHISSTLSVFGAREVESRHTAALVHPMECCGSRAEGKCVAHAFFNEEDLTPRVIAHEAVHIGMAVERFINYFGMQYGEQIDEHEERLAGLIGDIADSIVNTCNENKIRIR